MVADLLDHPDHEHANDRVHKRNEERDDVAEGLTTAELEQVLVADVVVLGGSVGQLAIS